MPDPESAVALVTGAASDIGVAVVERLMSDGFHVAATYHSTQRRLADLDPRPQLLERLDVRDVQAVDRCIETISERFGRLDCIVNNASHWDPALWAAEPRTLTDDDLMSIIDVDLMGSWRVTRAALDLLSVAPNASVVNFSSSGSVRGDANTFAYNPGQTAVIGLTKSFARAYAPAIRCNAIAPGSIETGWTERWGLSSDERENLDGVRNMAQRMGTPAEIASLVGYLASTESAYINGQVLFADGGVST